MKTIFSFLFSFIFSLTIIFAQNSPNSGDPELDVALSDMNVNAKANLKAFKKDLSVGFGIAEAKLEQLMISYGMQPADLYMALQIAKQTGKTPDQVGVSFNENKGKGWGVIAKEMGIKPGSKEFHALKDSAKGKNNKMKEKNKGKGGKGNGNGNGNGNKGKKK